MKLHLYKGDAMVNDDYTLQYFNAGTEFVVSPGKFNLNLAMV